MTSKTNRWKLGLFVVGQLAKRHGIKVTLRPSAYGGTSAIALIPTSLVGTDDGFAEALPAGASAAASAWPAQEVSAQEVPAQDATGEQVGRAGGDLARLAHGRRTDPNAVPGIEVNHFKDLARCGVAAPRSRSWPSRCQ